MTDDTHLWEQRWNQARSAWPSLDISIADFRSYVEQHAEPETNLQSVAIQDMYLACGCAHANREALRLFDETFGSEIHFVLMRLGQRGDAENDGRQAIYQRLFAGAAPKICEYRGRGSLKAWIRVVALRTTLNTMATRTPEWTEHGVLQLVELDGDPEIAFMKQTYAQEMRTALHQAVSALSAKERALLRLAFIDGLTIDDLGTLYGVHRATAARWVRQAHSNFGKLVRKHIGAKFRASETEIDSILRLVASRLDTNLTRYFK